MLDGRRRADQKTLKKKMEDEGAEYRQKNGVGETEHTGDQPTDKKWISDCSTNQR